MFLFYSNPNLEIRMCDSCLARKGVNCPDEMNYKNITSTNAWELTRISDADYLHMEPKISEWEQVPGWTLSTCMFDLMHNCFLGTARDFVAGGIRCLISCGRFSSLEEVHKDMIQTCSARGFLDQHDSENNTGYSKRNMIKTRLVLHHSPYKGHIRGCENFLELCIVSVLCFVIFILFCRITMKPAQ